ncbi:MAG: IS110 family transposase [Candidatus Omnitrophota bacterium]
MVTIAADVHLKTSTFSVVEGNRKIMNKKINNDPREILNIIERFPGSKQFSMEATYNRPVFYELLKDKVDDYILLHPKKLHHMMDSQSKCDKHDADAMARLTALGAIPRSYVAQAPSRQLRRLAHTYLNLASQIAGLKNKIHAVINSNTFYSQRPKNFKDLFCRRGRAFLLEIPLPEKERFLVDRLLDTIDQLQVIKRDLRDYIQSIDLHHDDLDILRTVPGFGGQVLSYVALSEIDNILRFKNIRCFIAYAGLAPRDKSSGEKNRKGRLRSDSNHYLQWAFIEAVPAAILKDRPLKLYYQQLKKTKSSSVARVILARRLAKNVYYMLKERKVYSSLNRESLTLSLLSASSVAA